MSLLPRSVPVAMTIVLALQVSSLKCAQTQHIPKPIPGASYAICTESQPVKEWLSGKLGLTVPAAKTTLLTTIFYTFDGNPLKQVVEKKEQRYSTDTPKTICETKDSYIDPRAPKPQPPLYRLREADFNTGSIRFVIKFYDKHGNVIDDYRIFGREVEKVVKDLTQRHNLHLQQERAYLPLDDFKKNFFEIYSALVHLYPDKFKNFDLSIAQEDTRYRKEDMTNLGNALYFTGVVGGTVLLLSPFLLVAGVITGIQYIYNALKAPFTKSEEKKAISESGQ